MKSLKFCPDSTGLIAADVLPLRMPQASGIIDPEPFRARARGEGQALAEAFAPSGGMRTLHAGSDLSCHLFDTDAPLLTFVISGAVAVNAGPADIVLEPGDVFLVESGIALARHFETRGDCRLIQLSVPADWPGERARPPKTDNVSTRENLPCNFKRMFKAEDGKSYFRNFDGLFADQGTWSATTPLIGFRFIGMAADTFIDWHPEIVNNLVIVMSGGLELEVGGGAGAVEIFRPGDVCLAEDRTGEGHIDRVHGNVQVAVLIVADEHLWP